MSCVCVFKSIQHMSQCLLLVSPLSPLLNIVVGTNRESIRHGPDLRGIYHFLRNTFGKKREEGRKIRAFDIVKGTM